MTDDTTKDSAPVVRAKPMITDDTSFAEGFRKKYQEQADKIGHFNLAIFGKTGVVKSAPINGLGPSQVLSKMKSFLGDLGGTSRLGAKTTRMARNSRRSLYA